MKKYLNKTNIQQYLLDQLTGNFAGFLIGTSATGLLSHFFETRSVRNLWGLTAHKKILNKETFSNLEWILSILIGFLVFELMTKVVKPRLAIYYSRNKFTLLRWMVRALQAFKIIRTKFKMIMLAKPASELTQR